MKEIIVKDKILIIQKQFITLNKKKFSKKYINSYILPIFRYIINSKNTKFIISGSQGVGKSTLLKILEKNFKYFYNKNILCLSLDDYYLSQKKRFFYSKKIHPLLSIRGVPGTHDIKKLIKHTVYFEKENYPFSVPIFNKIKDNPTNKNRKIKKKADILILEGWCCGCPPIKYTYLKKNINNIEKNLDKKLLWRKFYNLQLKNHYFKLFKKYDQIIYLKAPSFSYVLKWRLQQEKMLLKTKNTKNGMNKNQIFEFIQHYEKITKWMMNVLPKISNLTAYIGKNHKIKKITIN